MARVTFKGNPVNTSGELPSVGATAPDFSLVSTELSDVKLSDYKGKNIVLNIFPSLDTGTCAASVRRFNKEAVALLNDNIENFRDGFNFDKDADCVTKRLCTYINDMPDVVWHDGYVSTYRKGINDGGGTASFGPLRPNSKRYFARKYEIKEIKK